MAAPAIALIHSPLVGPGTWRGVAAALRAGGQARVETPAACAWAAEPPFHATLARRIVGQLTPAGAESWILVAHSGAGGILPAIGETPPLRVQGAVFVDAILPHPGQTWLETAPPDLAAALLARSRDGRAPPWPAWFPPGALERLLPDPRVRADFEAQCQGAPTAFLAEPAPVAAHWPPARCGYLQLSGGYRTEAAAAEAAGWTVVRQRRHHLAMITEPDKVALAIHRLIDALIGSSGGAPGKRIARA